MNPYDAIGTDAELAALEARELEQAELWELRAMGYESDEYPVTRQRLGTAGTKRYTGSQQPRRPRQRKAAAQPPVCSRQQ